VSIVRATVKPSLAAAGCAPRAKRPVLHAPSNAHAVRAAASSIDGVRDVRSGWTRLWRSAAEPPSVGARRGRPAEGWARAGRGGVAGRLRYSFAVKLMPRRFGVAGFISSRIAESIAAMA